MREGVVLLRNEVYLFSSNIFVLVSLSFVLLLTFLHKFSTSNELDLIMFFFSYELVFDFVFNSICVNQSLQRFDAKDVERERIRSNSSKEASW